ncbi:MAG: diaminopimelate epimerase [Phycisphaerales bacterium]
MRPTPMVRFTKMHGIGNDYIYVDGLQESVDDPEALARAIADRHTGVGGDGLILILPPQNGVEADLRMRMFNADGSESQMCGNGIRCVCKYAHDHGLANANPMRIETGAVVLALQYTLDGNGAVETVTVDMGEPILDLRAIPVDAKHLDGSEESTHRFTVDRESLVATFVSMGNPHAVIFVDDVARIDLAHIGSRIETHPAFPQRINVHFVQVTSLGEVTMRSWERGSGATQACGTGACAVGVAGVVAGRTDRKLLVHLPGGDLQLNWDERTNHVFMTGPAVEVFTGDWPD